jgi:hypothetical protein
MNATIENNDQPQDVNQFIIDNHKQKTVKEMAEILDIKVTVLRSKVIWLVRKNVIESKSKVKIVKTPKTVSEAITDVKNSIDVLDNIYKKIGGKTENNYSNHNGKGKNEARNIWVNYINNSNVVGKVPTLMNTETSGEEAMLQVNPKMEFIGVECHKPTLLKLRQIIRTKKLPIDTVYGKIEKMIYGVESDTYAHLILDYCGNLPSFSSEIEYAIEKNIVKVGGYIAITFCKTIRQQNSAKAQRILSLGKTVMNLEKNCCEADILTERYFSKVTGFNYSFVEMFNYRDTTPMTLIILKREK